MKQPSIPTFAEIPVTLHEKLVQFEKQNPTWDYDRLITAAVSLLLIKVGKMDDLTIDEMIGISNIQSRIDEPANLIKDKIRTHHHRLALKLKAAIDSSSIDVATLIGGYLASRQLMIEADMANEVTEVESIDPMLISVLHLDANFGYKRDELCR